MNGAAANATTEGTEFRRGWPFVTAAMFGIALGLSPIPFYTIGVFAPILAREFHWTFAQIFAGITCTTAAVIVASPMVGFTADRFGARRMAFTSVALFGLCLMGLALGNGSLALYLKLAVLGHADIVRLTSLIGLSVIVGRVLGGWLIDRVWAPAAACLILAGSALDYRTAMLLIGLIGSPPARNTICSRSWWHGISA